MSVMVGRYERDEVKPSIDTAAKIADALGVSLDYISGNTSQLLEKNIIKRITDIQQLPVDDKVHLFALMDAFLRDHKAKKAYATVKIKKPLIERPCYLFFQSLF